MICFDIGIREMEIVGYILSISTSKIMGVVKFYCRDQSIYNCCHFEILSFHLLQWICCQELFHKMGNLFSIPEVSELYDKITTLFWLFQADDRFHDSNLGKEHNPYIITFVLYAYFIYTVSIEFL